MGLDMKRDYLSHPRKAPHTFSPLRGQKACFPMSADDVYKIRIVVGRPPSNFDRCICLHQNATRDVYQQCQLFGHVVELKRPLEDAAHVIFISIQWQCVCMQWSLYIKLHIICICDCVTIFGRVVVLK